MGQQQLLLVILVTIIVGIATVIAINTFGGAAENANLNAVRQDIAQIAAAAQGYYMRPATMGGNDQDFSAITFDDFGSIPGTVDSGDNKILTNENASYTIGSRTTQSFVITAQPVQATGTLTATVVKDGIDGGITYNESGT